MPRSLTKDDALETSEVAEGPAPDCQRAHDGRVAATAAVFKQDANTQNCKGDDGRVRWPDTDQASVIGSWFIVATEFRIAGCRCGTFCGGSDERLHASGRCCGHHLFEIGDARSATNAAATTREGKDAVEWMPPHLREDLQRRRRPEEKRHKEGVQEVEG